MKTVEVYHPDSNRVGKFNVLDETVRDDASMVGALLKLCTVLSETRHESGRGRLFIAASPLFQPLLEGEEIPEYMIEFVYGGRFEREDRERDRIDSGPFGFVAVRNFIVRVPTIGIGHRVH